jgi:hypothetical protein
MRVVSLVALLLLPMVGLAGCSAFDKVPEGCGEERRHHLVFDQFNPVSHARNRTFGNEDVYVWEIAVTDACPKEHAEIELRLETADDFSGCRGPTSVAGSAYLPGSFVSAQAIPMQATGDLSKVVYEGSSSYGLRQGDAGGRTTYTVDISAHFPAGHDSDCPESTIREVEIVVVDRVAK